MLKKTALLMAFCLLPFNYAQAQTPILATSYHGTNCMTANLAQGALFSWNAKGLSNNFPAALFVICPLPLEHSAITAGATEIRVAADWYLPPSYTGVIGPRCYLRIQQSGFGLPDPNYYVNEPNDATISANGLSGFNGFTNFSVAPIPFNNSGVTEDTLISAHLLCLVPPASTLISYNIEWDVAPM